MLQASNHPPLHAGLHVNLFLCGKKQGSCVHVLMKVKLPFLVTALYYAKQSLFAVAQSQLSIACCQILLYPYKATFLGLFKIAKWKSFLLKTIKPKRCMCINEFVSG